MNSTLVGLQWPAVVEPLAMTVHALLHPGQEGGTRVKKYPPVFYLGIVERDDGALKRKFFSLLQSYGFSEARKINYEEYLSRDLGAGDEAFLFPPKGSEFGGRVCMIYEIFLINLEPKPVLLQRDQILSTGYEATLTLPCVNANFS